MENQLFFLHELDVENKVGKLLYLRCVGMCGQSCGDSPELFADLHFYIGD